MEKLTNSFIFLLKKIFVPKYSARCLPVRGSHFTIFEFHGICLSEKKRQFKHLISEGIRMTYRILGRTSQRTQHLSVTYFLCGSSAVSVRKSYPLA
jgi:hypothetical protein